MASLFHKALYIASIAGVAPRRVHPVESRRKFVDQTAVLDRHLKYLGYRPKEVYDSRVGGSYNVTGRDSFRGVPDRCFLQKPRSKLSFAKQA